jgi:penicillin-binding protein A
VLIEVETGAVVAMWSYPSFDPNLVSDPDYDAAFDYLTELQADPATRCSPTPYQQRYMPGSTFKVLTTGAALDFGRHRHRVVLAGRAEFAPAAGHQTGRELRRLGVRRRPRRGVPSLVQHTVRPHGHRPRSRPVPGGHGAVGVGETIPIDLPGAAASTIGDFTDIDQNLPLLAMRGSARTRSRWCRSTWRWSPPRSRTTAR